MSCFDDYVTIDNSTSSRSGLYAVSLPGVELSLLQALTKEDQNDYRDLWDMVYDRARVNLISDISNSIDKKFRRNLKLLSRDSSDFIIGSPSGGSSGIKLQFLLPKYARLHIISVDVISEQDYDCPDVTINIYNTDSSGELLYSKSQSVQSGRNTFFIDTDFEVNNVFVTYNSNLFSLRSTSNKLYQSPYISFSDKSCEFPCWYDGIYTGTIQQINGGGLNVKYVVHCSIDKFVCDNINIFGKAFWWKIGQELVIERRFGNNLNRFTTMTVERSEELMGFYQAQYAQEIGNAINSQNIDEDIICFSCKSVVSNKTLLP